MLGHILGLLLLIGLVAVIYTECIKPVMRNWRNKK